MWPNGPLMMAEKFLTSPRIGPRWESGTRPGMLGELEVIVVCSGRSGGKAERVPAAQLKSLGRSRLAPEE